MPDGDPPAAAAARAPRSFNMTSAPRTPPTADGAAEPVTQTRHQRISKEAVGTTVRHRNVSQDLSNAPPVARVVVYKVPYSIPEEYPQLTTEEEQRLKQFRADLDAGRRAWETSTLQFLALGKACSPLDGRPVSSLPGEDAAPDVTSIEASPRNVGQLPPPAKCVSAKPSSASSGRIDDDGGNHQRGSCSTLTDDGRVVVISEARRAIEAATESARAAERASEIERRRTSIKFAAGPSSGGLKMMEASEAAPLQGAAAPHVFNSSQPVKPPSTTGALLSTLLLFRLRRRKTAHNTVHPVHPTPEGTSAGYAAGMKTSKAGLLAEMVESTAVEALSPGSAGHATS